MVGNVRDDHERCEEDEGKNCGFADDGTGSERDKEKLNEGGGVGDEINENEGRIGEDDRDVDRGENCDRDG